MKRFNAIRPFCISFILLTLAVLTFALPAAAQQNWHAEVGAQTPGMGRQALAFLPNELWIHTGDSITWTFNSGEIHTVSFLVVGQDFPAFADGCPGFSVGTASFDGSTCKTTPPEATGDPNFTVTFPSAGNFKIQCLVHTTMNGIVHVLDPSIALPHDQHFYDTEAANEERDLLNDNDHAMGSEMNGMKMSHADHIVSPPCFGRKEPDCRREAKEVESLVGRQYARRS
jgi:plastocyanin